MDYFFKYILVINIYILIFYISQILELRETNTEQIKINKYNYEM